MTSLLRQAAGLSLLCLGLILGGCSRGGAGGAALPVSQPSANLPKATPSQAAPGALPVIPAPISPAAPGSTLAPPGVTVIPSLTFTPSPTPTTQKPVLRPLTQGGCCVQPFWSPDSQRVLYLDRPDPGAPAGFWGVSIEGGPPSLWSDRLGLYSSDLSQRAYPAGGQTIIERLADGQTWNLANGGRAVSFAPGGAQVAWTSGQSGPPFDSAVRQVWVAEVGGLGGPAGPARQVLSGVGVGFAGWLPDGRMLVTTRLAAPDRGQAVSILTPAAQSNDPPALREVTRAERLRSLALSPGGSWLAYVVSFAEDPAESGLWLVELATGQCRKIEPFGAFRWRDDARLLVVPLEPDAPSQRLLQVEAASGLATPLFDPQAAPFKIANGDWSVSPDGRFIVFVSAYDQNLWLLELP